MERMVTLMAGATIAQATSKFEARARDWREGAVVYQVFVDRFVPPASRKPDEMRWSETPQAGHPVPALGVWSHELPFWGGTLRGVATKLDYMRSLGADVLYLTPIFDAFTNHGYDTRDYTRISPRMGTQQDLKTLIHGAHARRMKLMLDGVFNHMGRTSPIFQSALRNPKSPYRGWFTFEDGSYRAWSGVLNLPVLQLENPQLRDYLWNGHSSIVKRYLQDGIDGWRLDVGYEIGPSYLNEITRAAHATKPGSDVVGEIWGYPSGWFPQVDGVFDFFCLDVVKQALAGTLTGGRANRELQHVVEDAGIENLLRSWLVLDNHDTPRLTSMLPDLSQRKLAVAMQFTLPGCPVIYYGTELGMQGSGDPANRAPMRWDLVSGDNPNLAWVKRLSALRKSLPALRYGDFTALDTEQLIAFTRTTDKLGESVIVVANPTSHDVEETLPTRIGRLMSYGSLRDALTGTTVLAIEGSIGVKLAPYQTLILSPILTRANRRIP